MQAHRTASEWTDNQLEQAASALQRTFNKASLAEIIAAVNTAAETVAASDGDALLADRAALLLAQPADQMPAEPESS